MKTRKATQICSGILFGSAAYLTIALLLHYLDYNTLVQNESILRSVVLFLFAPGKILYSVYGFSSALIPVFLLAAGILLFTTEWNNRWIVYLFGSIFPFFTIVCAEALYKLFVSHDASFFNTVKAVTIWFVVAVLIVIEYILLGILNDSIFSRQKKIRSSDDLCDSDSAASVSKESEVQEEMPVDDEEDTAVNEIKENYADSEIEGSMEYDFPVAEDISKENADVPIFLDLHWREKTEMTIEEAESHSELFHNDEEARFLENPFEDEKSNSETICDDEESVNEDEIIDEDDELLKKTIEEIPFYTTPPLKAVLSENDSVSGIKNESADAVVSSVAKFKRNAPYYIPSEGILKNYPDGEYWIIDDATNKAAMILKETLHEFKIQAEVTGIRKGPVITMFEILPAPGVRLSKIVNLQDNISLRLAASSVRIVAPIPGKHAVGIEVPNKQRAIVSFKELIETDAAQIKKMEIPVILGKDITGEAILLDLAATPHLLIAGSTGSGKSVCVNTMILSILYRRSPQDVRLILIDPKIVELKLYNDIPHLLTPVITEPKKAFQALQYCLCEMERRYAMLDRMGVRDIKSYNRRIIERDLATEKLPYIVVVIDEFADLMATTGKELESTVARLAAMSRAVGVHLVLATQRPSIDVITGLIKANIPTRIAFMVASKMDSRIIIDQMGAEKLLGKGDMLYASAVDPFPVRIQGAFVTEDEVENVVEYVKQYGAPEYIDEEIFFDDEDEELEPSLFSDGDDPLYEKALEIVLQAGKASASYIQRRLKIGYNRAARLVEEMEQRGIVGPANGSKPRDIMHIPSK